MSFTNRIHAIPMATLDGNSLNINSWVRINPTGLLQPCFIIRIINDTDQDISISYDGVNAHDFIQAGATLELSPNPQMHSNNNTSLFHRDLIVYALGATTANGNVYLSGYFNIQI
jgi:hypothetical protein